MKRATDYRRAGKAVKARGAERSGGRLSFMYSARDARDVTGISSRERARSVVLRRTVDLTLLDTADNLRELSLPGLRPHPIGDDRYAIDVNGPWRITFEWEDGDALRVDLEQYH